LSGSDVFFSRERNENPQHVVAPLHCFFSRQGIESTEKKRKSDSAILTKIDRLLAIQTAATRAPLAGLQKLLHQRLLAKLYKTSHLEMAPGVKHLVKPFFALLEEVELEIVGPCGSWRRGQMHFVIFTKNAIGTLSSPSLPPPEQAPLVSLPSSAGAGGARLPPSTGARRSFLSLRR
jgi:hypothetical protein